MNWYEVIKAAKDRGSFTEDEKDRAKDWLSCACGQLDPRIERSLSGAPRDGTLYLLGCDFNTCVQRDMFAEVGNTLKKIEARERFLLGVPVPVPITIRVAGSYDSMEEQIG